MALLDCLGEGAAREEGGPLRELCAKGIVEFLRYAIKQSSKRQQVREEEHKARVVLLSGSPEEEGYPLTMPWHELGFVFLEMAARSHFEKLDRVGGFNAPRTPRVLYSKSMGAHACVEPGI